MDTATTTGDEYEPFENIERSETTSTPLISTKEAMTSNTTLRNLRATEQPLLSDSTQYQKSARNAGASESPLPGQRDRENRLLEFELALKESPGLARQSLFVVYEDSGHARTSLRLVRETHTLDGRTVTRDHGSLVASDDLLVPCYAMSSDRNRLEVAIHHKLGPTRTTCVFKELDQALALQHAITGYEVICHIPSVKWSGKYGGTGLKRKLVPRKGVIQIWRRRSIQAGNRGDFVFKQDDDRPPDYEQYDTNESSRPLQHKPYGNGKTYVFRSTQHSLGSSEPEWPSYSPPKLSSQVELSPYQREYIAVILTHTEEKCLAYAAIDAHELGEKRSALCECASHSPHCRRLIYQNPVRKLHIRPFTPTTSYGKASPPGQWDSAIFGPLSSHNGERSSVRDSVLLKPRKLDFLNFEFPTVAERFKFETYLDVAMKTPVTDLDLPELRAVIANHPLSRRIKDQGPAAALIDPGTYSNRAKLGKLLSREAFGRTQGLTSPNGAESKVITDDRDQEHGTTSEGVNLDSFHKKNYTAEQLDQLNVEDDQRPLRSPAHPQDPNALSSNFWSSRHAMELPQNIIIRPDRHAPTFDESWSNGPPRNIKRIDKNSEHADIQLETENRPDKWSSPPPTSTPLPEHLVTRKHGFPKRHAKKLPSWSDTVIILASCVIGAFVGHLIRLIFAHIIATTGFGILFGIINGTVIYGAAIFFLVRRFLRNRHRYWSPKVASAAHLRPRFHALQTEHSVVTKAPYMPAWMSRIPTQIAKINLAARSKLNRGIMQIVPFNGVSTGSPKAKTGLTAIKWRCECGKHFTHLVSDRSVSEAMRLSHDRSSTNATKSHQESASGGYFQGEATSDTASYSSSASKFLSTQDTSLPENGLESQIRRRRGFEDDRKWVIQLLSRPQAGNTSYHHRVTSSTVDKELMKILRATYEQQRSRWFQWCRLRAVTGIRFVKFQLFRNNFAGITGVSVWPPSDQSKTWDPTGITSAPLCDDYIMHQWQNAFSKEPHGVPACDPERSEATNAYLHALNRTSCPADEESVLPPRMVSQSESDMLECLIFNSTAKKLGEKMVPALSVDRSIIEGYGVHIAEQFRVGVSVWICLMAYCLLSILIGVIWSAKSADNDKFGIWNVSACLIAVGGIVSTTWLAAARSSAE